MIEDTYAVLGAWDFCVSKKKNLDRLRATNFIGAKSETWLRDVAKVINRRFDPAGPDRALCLLAQGGCSLEEWKPVLLWHITRDEFLLRDFLRNWLFPAYDAGAFRVRPEQLHKYLRDIGKRGGTTEHEWADSTLGRSAANARCIKTVDDKRDFALPDDVRTHETRLGSSVECRPSKQFAACVVHSLLAGKDFRMPNDAVAGRQVFDTFAHDVDGTVTMACRLTLTQPHLLRWLFPELVIQRGCCRDRSSLRDKRTRRSGLDSSSWDVAQSMASPRWWDR